MRLANRLLHRCTPPEKFVTLFLAVLDPSDGSLTFANAGHNPPLLVGAGEECARLSTKGIVLGLLDDFAFAQDRAIIREGGVLVIFSDGVSEALDATDGEFGEERLIDIVREQRAAPADAIQYAILEAVRRHVGTTPQSDDITLVVVKRRSA